MTAYAAAYTEAVRVALLTTGLGALGGSVIAGLVLGPRDPLQTVWELQDERPTPVVGATTPVAPSSADRVAPRTGR